MTAALTRRLTGAPRLLREIALTAGALVGTLCLLTALAALVLDVRVLSFRSGSMSPTIPTGALALARSVPAADLRVGDVVSVRTATGSRVTHRVVDVTHHGDRATLELRGDANEVADPTPYEVRSAYRVLGSCPWLGYAGSWLVSPFGMFALGLYAAALLLVLLRPRHGSSGTRHRRPVGAAGAVVVTLVVAAAGTTVATRTTPTQAAWVDGAATTGSTFSTGSVPAPASFTCGALGIFSVTFNWSAVPGATSYTLHYGSSGATTSAPITGTTTTVTTLISGGTAWITANRNFGSTTWTSVPSSTRSYSVIAISICA
ncbi:MAG: signal peptidase I [Marmoricola sp.]